MKVFYSPNTIIYFRELVEILYLNDYFGFKDDAKEYVTTLIREINDTIDKKLKKPAPAYFSKYGDDLYYVGFRKNKNTQWFVFFNIKDDGYYIEYIGNNHTVAQFL